MSRKLKTHSNVILYRLLTFFFHHLYHTFAWLYDWVAWVVSFGQWKKWGETSLSYCHGEKVLDMGCGPGHVSACLIRSGYKVFGLDESWQMTRIYYRNIKKNTSPAISRGKSQNTPFVTSFFDCIVSTFPTNDIFDPNTIQETYRILTPDGTLVILLGIKITETNLPYKILSRLYQFTGESVDESKVFANYKNRIQSHAPYKVVGQLHDFKNIRLLYLICKKAENENTK